VSRPILLDSTSAIQNRIWKSQLEAACKSAFAGRTCRTPRCLELMASHTVVNEPARRGSDRFYETRDLCIPRAVPLSEATSSALRTDATILAGDY